MWMPREIELSRGKVALVDEQDFEWLSKLCWRAVPADQENENWYAKGNGEYMHRMILGASEGEETDHRDHNGLNNVRSNLRLATRSQNCANIIYPPPSSGFRGVWYDKHKRCFTAQTSAKRKTIRIGRFRTAIEAALARDAYVKILFGEFAVLNFPDAQNPCPARTAIIATTQSIGTETAV
jgi:hypothetical protein